MPLVVLPALAASVAWLKFLSWIGPLPWPVTAISGFIAFFGTMFFLAMGFFRALQLWGRD